MMLNAYYRAPVSFSDETIKEAQVNLEKLKTTYKQLAVQLQLQGVDLSSIKKPDESAFSTRFAKTSIPRTPYRSSMKKNKTANQLLRSRPLNLQALSDSFARLKDYFFVLGLGLQYPNLTEGDRELYNQYLGYKAAKNFAESDLLRGQLMAKGIL
jgi:cysteinyl-tRNA synthetase